MNILIVEVAGTRCGIPLEAVREVLRAAAVTPLPGAPATVDGVLNVRGAVLPVFDLATRMGGAHRPPDPQQRLVVAAAGARTVALRVDRVEWFLSLDAAELAAAPEATPHAPYIRGVARMPDGLALVHDLERLLSHEEEEALEEALSSAVARGAGA